jgi:hypothetical protein
MELFSWIIFWIVVAVILSTPPIMVASALGKYLDKRQLRKAAQQFANAVMRGQAPPKGVLDLLKDQHEQFESWDIPAGFFNRFGNGVTYDGAVRQYRKERRLEREGSAAIRKHKDIVERLATLISDCSSAWEQAVRAASALNASSLSRSLPDIVKHDVLQILSGFSAANGDVTAQLGKLFQALSRAWKLKLTLRESTDQIGVFDRERISVPNTVRVMHGCDQLLGNSFPELWADLFSSIVSVAATCCEDSFAVTALSKEYANLLEPYRKRSTDDERASHWNGSGYGNLPDAEASSCSKCASGYDLLELPFGAGRDAVIDAKREMAKNLHPDVWLNKRGARVAEEQLKRINAACDHLLQCRLSRAEIQ